MLVISATCVIFLSTIVGCETGLELWVWFRVLLPVPYHENRLKTILKKQTPFWFLLWNKLLRCGGLKVSHRRNREYPLSGKGVTYSAFEFGKSLP